VSSEPERQIYLIRHGDTEWSRSGQHTGRTDIPLTDSGRAQAIELGKRLRDHEFAFVLTSPMSRAAETARIAGFGDATHDADLREWDYGELEGRTTDEIRTAMPGWTIWGGPWPGGESAEQVGARVDRVLAARWLEEPPSAGGHFALGTATIGILGWERENRVIETWNEACHLTDGI
jgi:broad specificity phosphatase PhoE